MTAPAGLLRLDRLTKRFGGLTALNEVSLGIARGGITGVIGPNGAGKTTLFNLITGAYVPTSGTVTLEDRPIGGLRPFRIARRGIARTFQNIRLFRSMTVWEHLFVAQPVRHWSAAVLPVAWSGAAALDRARQALDLFRLAEFRDRLAVTLPYGVQRRVEIARALMAEPALLLLDEPVAGMNAEEAEDLRMLLRELARTGATTILLIEHDMPFVMGLCDHLYVLDFGSLIAQGPPEAVRRDEAVLDAYLGREA